MAIPETSRVIGHTLFRPVFGSISELLQHLPLGIPESPLLVPSFWVERRHLLATRSAAASCEEPSTMPSIQFRRCVVFTVTVQATARVNCEVVWC